MNIKLKIGDSAYFDSFNGLIPCVVHDIYQSELGRILVKLKVKKDIGAYKKGEYIITPWLRAIPPKAIKKTKYETMIKPYTVEIPTLAGPVKVRYS